MRSLEEVINEDIIPSIYEDPERAFGGTWRRTATAQRCREHILTDGHPAHDGFGGTYIRYNRQHIIADGSDSANYSEVVKLFQERNQIGTRFEAARRLASIYGTLFDVEQKWTPSPEYMRRQEMRESDAEDVRKMVKATDSDSQEAAYLRERGITDEMRESNNIFVVNDETAPILSGLYMRHQAEATPFPAGVEARGTHTIGTPIFEKGTIVAIYFRTISNDVTPKYKAWKFEKDAPIMFGLNKSAPKTHKTLAIVEGVFDVISAQDAIGTLYDVAGYLSSSLTKDQAHAIAQAGYKNVIQVVDFDGVRKAQNTANFVKRTAASLKEEGISVLVADLIDGKNPDTKQDANSYVQAFGKEAFIAVVKNARHVTGYLTDATARAVENGTDEEKLNARDAIMQMLAEEASADVVRDILNREDTPTARIFGDVKALRQELADARQKAAAEAKRQKVAALYNAAAEYTKKFEDRKAIQCVMEAQAAASENETVSWSTLVKGTTRDAIYKQLEKKTDGLVTPWGVSYDGTTNGRTPIVIPPSAITTITAKTGHGKTKMLMNIVLMYLRECERTGKRVVVVPYEEDMSDTAVNLINLKASAHLMREIQGEIERDNKAIIAYCLRKRERMPAVVEEAKEFIFEAIESGRLIIIDNEPTVEDIARIALDASDGIAALCIDYLQQITTTDKRATDSKSALVTITRTLNSIARTTGTAIVATSQFNRECFSPIEMTEDKNAAASNIEWSSSQNFGVFSSYHKPTSAAWNAGKEEAQRMKNAGFDPENPRWHTMLIKVLKSRQRGQAGQWGVMTFDGNTGRIGKNFKEDGEKNN